MFCLCFDVYNRKGNIQLFAQSFISEFTGLHHRLGVDCVQLAEVSVQWLALINMVVNLKWENFFTWRVTISFSRRTLLLAVSYK